MILRYVLKALVLPPMLQLLMMLAALVLWRWRPRLARALGALAVISLWLLATPFTANALLEPLETHYPFLRPGEARTTDAQAIVVLAAGVVTNAHEFGHPMSSRDTLIRLRYGATLHRETGLPILVSGGRVFDDLDTLTLADVMARDLETQFKVPVAWRERRSRTTEENAEFSAAMLKKEGIDTVLLVTEAYHMPRSVFAFENAGLTVIPAPTSSYGMPDAGLLKVTPSALALNGSSIALHEYLGYWVYKLLY